MILRGTQFLSIYDLQRGLNFGSPIMVGAHFGVPYDLKNGLSFGSPIRGGRGEPVLDPFDPQREPSSWVSLIFSGDSIWIPYDERGPSFGSPMILRGDPVLGPVLWEAEGTQFWVPYDPQWGPSSWVSMIFRGDSVLGPLLREMTQFWSNMILRGAKFCVPYDPQWGPSSWVCMIFRGDSVLGPLSW